MYKAFVMPDFNFPLKSVGYCFYKVLLPMCSTKVLLHSRPEVTINVPRVTTCNLCGMSGWPVSTGAFLIMIKHGFCFMDGMRGARLQSMTEQIEADVLLY